MVSICYTLSRPSNFRVLKHLKTRAEFESDNVAEHFKFPERPRNCFSNNDARRRLICTVPIVSIELTHFLVLPKHETPNFNTFSRRPLI